MSNLAEELKQTKEDITFMRSSGPLMRALLVEQIREEFTAKAKDPSIHPLKRLGYRAGAVLTHAIF